MWNKNVWSLWIHLCKNILTRLLLILDRTLWLCHLTLLIHLRSKMISILIHLVLVLLLWHIRIKILILLLLIIWILILILIWHTLHHRVRVIRIIRHLIIHWWHLWLLNLTLLLLGDKRLGFWTRRINLKQFCIGIHFLWFCVCIDSLFNLLTCLKLAHHGLIIRWSWCSSLKCETICIKVCSLLWWLGLFEIVSHCIL